MRNRATIEHCLELLGEASGAVGTALRSRNPNVPWSALSRFRFDSAHPYDDAAKPENYEGVWRFVTKDLPRIERRLRAVEVPKGEE